MALVRNSTAAIYCFVRDTIKEDINTIVTGMREDAEACVEIVAESAEAISQIAEIVNDAVIDGVKCGTFNEVIDKVCNGSLINEVNATCALQSPNATISAYDCSNGNVTLDSTQLACVNYGLQNYDVKDDPNCWEYYWPLIITIGACVTGTVGISAYVIKCTFFSEKSRAKTEAELKTEETNLLVDDKEPRTTRNMRQGGSSGSE